MLILLTITGLIVGILTTIFHMSPAIAASTSLATMIHSMVIGAYSHHKQGTVNIKAGNKMLVYAAIGTIVGALLSPHIPENIYMLITAIILLLLGLQMLYQFLFGKNNLNTKNNKNWVIDI
jgi:uncharacterized membrane protein YfcA